MSEHRFFNERRIFGTALFLGLAGIVVSVVRLAATSKSGATVQVILASAIGVALVTAIVVGYFVFTRIKYLRLKDKRLQQASEAMQASEAISKVPEDVQRQLRELLEAAAEEVASQQQLEQSQVRAALLLPEGESLRMIHSLTWHITDPEELEIRIGLGQGSSGRAFQTGQPNVAIYHVSQADSSLPEQQRRRVDANLKWIISTPVLGSSDDAVVAVLNVDGLVEKTEEELLRSAGSLAYWAQLAGLILGEPPKEV
jgi:hypothetical protein